MTLFAMKGNIFVNFLATEKVTTASFVVSRVNKVCGTAKQMIVNTMFAKIAYRSEKSKINSTIFLNLISPSLTAIIVIIRNFPV